MRYAVALFLMVGLLLPPSTSGHEPETPAARSSSLQVKGPSGLVLDLDQEALARLPAREIRAATHQERESTWKGVALRELLQRVDAPLDEKLRGRGLANVVRVTATDGYQVIFSIAELDAGFGNAEVLVAYQRDGELLKDDGSFRLVVPADRRAGRWVRNVARIEVLDLRSESMP